MGHIHLAEHHRTLHHQWEARRTRRGAALLASLQGERSEPLPLSLAEAPPISREEDSLTDALCSPGRITELVGAEGEGGLSLSLQLMRELYARDPHRYLFMLPRFSLCAYALSQQRIPLPMSVVTVVPPAERLRFAVRALKSEVFSVVFVDARDAPLHAAQVAIRRVALAAETARTSVILCTSPKQKASLPVAIRARIQRHALISNELEIQPERHIYGRFAPLRYPLPVHDGADALTGVQSFPAQRKRRGATKARGWRLRRDVVQGGAH